MCVNCYQNLYTDTVTEFFALFKYSAVVHEKQSNSPSYQLIHGKYCLHHCFIDKSRLVRRNISTEPEYLSHTIHEDISSESLQNFHEYLRKMTNKFTQNTCHAKDNTYHDLRHLRNHKDIVLLSGDKDSSVVVMNKVDYIKKAKGMIKEGIQQGEYEMTMNTTDEDLEKFQSFLYCNFKSHPRYIDMRPVSD